MLLSSFFAHSMVFAHIPKAQLPFILFSETFLTIRQNSLNVTVCMIACTFDQGYFYKRYKELADYDKKNAFDVEKYLNHNLTFSKDTEFEMFRIDVTEDEIRQIEIIN